MKIVWGRSSSEELLPRGFLLFNMHDLCSKGAQRLLVLSDIDPPEDRIGSVFTICVRGMNQQTLLHSRYMISNDQIV